MSSIASQLTSLRKQHQSAVAAYDFQRADLIHQQIQSLQQQVFADSRISDRTHAELEFEYHRDEITTKSLQEDHEFAEQRAEIACRFSPRKHAIERFFQEECDQLSAQHALALERETSRAIPEVDALLSESRIYGKQHNYEQARAVHDQAMKIKNSVNNDRRQAVDAVFLRNMRKLRERKAAALAHIEQREKTALAAVDRKRDEAASVVSQSLRVKDLKADRLRREAVRSERSGGMSMSFGRSAPTPRRSRSIVSDSVLPKRSWQLAMESQ
jgi:hypothetical protein